MKFIALKGKNECNYVWETFVDFDNCYPLVYAEIALHDRNLFSEGKKLQMLTSLKKDS